MLSTCRIVPSLACAALFFLPGCFLAHSLDDEPCLDRPRPADVVCCAFGGPVAPETTCPFVCPRGSSATSSAECGWAPPPDDGGTVAPPVDAGPLACPSVRADATCLESFVVAPGVPFELPVTFDTCACFPASECRAEVDAASQTLRLTTALCPDTADCEVCEAPRASCAVPALREGSWNVVVNGAPAFALPVFADSGFAPPPPACATYAQPDRCAISERIDPIGWRPSEVCIAPRPGSAAGGEVVVTVASQCWGCGDLGGPCIATLEERFTDDLPPGGELRLAPTHHRTECDVACTDICIRAEHRCLVPQLTPGHFYRVWADGESMLSFFAGEPGRVCGGGGLIPG